MVFDLRESSLFLAICPVLIVAFDEYSVLCISSEFTHTRMQNERNKTEATKPGAKLHGIPQSRRRAANEQPCGLSISPTISPVRQR